MTTAPQNPTPVRDAATVVMLRDGAQGIETYMLRRHRGNHFGPGFYVFPGGAVDAADADPALAARCDGLDDDEACRRLGIAGGGRAFWIAAIRECFEEANLLVATDAQGEPLGPALALEQQRQALNAGHAGMREVCEALDIRLPLERMVYYGHWITPEGEPRRYSTRFFACVAPAGQAAEHDGAETTEGAWLRPAEALQRFESDELAMMPPTVYQLRFLDDYRDTDEVLGVLRAIHEVPTVTPRIVRRDGRVQVVL